MKAYVKATTLLAVLGLSILTLCLTGHKATSETAESFDTVARRSFSAVRDGNWDALKRDAASRMVFAQYMRGYTQGLSREQVHSMFPADLFTERDLTSPDVSRYHVVYGLVDTTKPLGIRDVVTFKTFSKYVRESWTTERSSNEFAQDNAAVEVRELVGPAVSGAYASNVNWRIELERNSGRWRVNRLVLMLH